MKLTLWSAGDKPQRVGTVTVAMVNGMPPELIYHDGTPYGRAYYGGWAYDELTVGEAG
jgi:hypothetical protein